MMRTAGRTFGLLLLCLGATAHAGALYIEVSSSNTNPEAKQLHAALVARVTACHEPEKSVVLANVVRVNGGTSQRSPLHVVALKTQGTYAILGDIPPDSVVDVMVTNPQFPNYQPHVLVGGGDKEVRWADAKHFRDAPTNDDIKGVTSR